MVVLKFALLNDNRSTDFSPIKKDTEQLCHSFLKTVRLSFSEADRSKENKRN